MPTRAGYTPFTTPKKTEIAGRAALLAALGTLPSGRARVALALVSGREAPTYPEVAAGLGLGVGTVHTHLRRLVRRHKAALVRDAEHSRRWHRKQANRRFYARYGYWPWER